MKKGFSLIETLIVIGIFAVIALVIAQATAISLTGSRKAEASTNVRENLTQAMDVIERQLRGARSISAADCTGSPVSQIDYVDEFGTARAFSCNFISTNCTASTNSYVSWGTERITSRETVCVTSCSFTCTPAGTQPPTVNVVLEGRNKNSSNIEGSSVRLETGVTLRAY